MPKVGQPVGKLHGQCDLADSDLGTGVAEAVHQYLFVLSTSTSIYTLPCKCRTAKMSRFAPHGRTGTQPRATASTVCQKCLGTGGLKNFTIPFMVEAYQSN